jgi:predicted glycoside hydrolase/deacetylase ChbG (UPF0249 family)
VTRTLIVTADDFGLSPGINRGVARAHERGIVTSASLMVRHEAAAAATQYAREHPDLSLGLHVDLGEWVRDGDEWTELYRLEPTAEEVERQLDAFRRLTGRDPSHVDSHQHVHREEPASSLLVELAARLRVPLREFSGKVRYRGDFYGRDARWERLPDAIAVDALVAVVRALPEGVTELGCHPGEPDGLVTSYAAERAVEVDTLCHPRVREALAEEGIALRSFYDAFS